MPEWDMVAQTRPEIKPLLGWYDEGCPEVIDWQIKWAVEHGITSFCVDWYWNRGRRRLEHWVKGYYKAQMWSETEFIMELSKNLDPELRQRLLMEVRLVNETPDSIMLDIMKQEIDEDQKIYYITSMYMAHLRSLKYMHEALSDKTMAIK
jgi:hypothetical protein